MTKRDQQAAEYRSEKPDFIEELKGVPDRLAKQAFDEILRLREKAQRRGERMVRMRQKIAQLRAEGVSLKSSVQYWCNEVHRLCDK